MNNLIIRDNSCFLYLKRAADSTISLLRENAGSCFAGIQRAVQNTTASTVGFVSNFELRISSFVSAYSYPNAMIGSTSFSTLPNMTETTETKPSVPAAVGPAGLWAALREAVRGSQQDFTEGSIGRAILLLAVPMVMEMAMESVFAVVDIFFVSKLGPDAVATVGITESMITVIYAVAMGLSMSAAAMVARRIGEKDPGRAAAAAVQAIALGIAVALPLGVAGVLLAPTLLRVMGAAPAVVQTGSGYTAVLFGGNVSILLIFLINAIFRGAGDAAIAMRVLWLANFINAKTHSALLAGIIEGLFAPVIRLECNAAGYLQEACQGYPNFRHRQVQLSLHLLHASE